MIDWSKYPNFTREEFKCKHTGKDGILIDFMDRLQALRAEYGKPLKVVSGYRHTSHPEEKSKPKGSIGTHPLGKAVDLKANGSAAFEIVALAKKHGFTGIGLHQKDGHTLVHLDIATTSDGKARPLVWTY
jgi:uncharacterized protein YcbK (DUF882 family)